MSGRFAGIKTFEELRARFGGAEPDCALSEGEPATLDEWAAHVGAEPAGGLAGAAEYIDRRLADLAALTANWDSYGARPVTTEAIAAARVTALAVIDAHPVIVPTCAGGVLVEWDGDGYAEHGPTGDILQESD